MARQAPALFTAALSLLSCFQTSLVAAGPVTRRSDLIVKDYHRAPRGWTNAGPAPAEHLIHLTIGLSQSRFDELERHLYEGTNDGIDNGTARTDPHAQSRTRLTPDMANIFRRTKLMSWSSHRRTPLRLFMSGLKSTVLISTN
jgi:hypothetical protein